MSSNRVLDILDDNLLTNEERAIKVTQLIKDTGIKFAQKDACLMVVNNLSQRGTIADYFPKGNEIYTGEYIKDSEGNKHPVYNPQVYIILKVVDGTNGADCFTDEEIRDYFDIQVAEWRYFKNKFFSDWDFTEKRENYISEQCADAKRWYRERNGATRMYLDDDGKIVIKRNLLFGNKRKKASF